MAKSTGKGAFIWTALASLPAYAIINKNNNEKVKKISSWKKITINYDL